MTDYELIDQLRQRWTDLTRPVSSGGECNCGEIAMHWLARIEEGALEHNPSASPEEIATETIHQLGTALAVGMNLVEEQENARGDMIDFLQALIGE